MTTSVAEICTEATATCLNGACVACTPMLKRCAGNSIQTCSAEGSWGVAEPCPTSTPVCSVNACIVPPSCAGLPTNCGASRVDSCCSSPVVPGRTYNRSNDPQYPATVSEFRLDAYEITVGRFKKFVAAYAQNMTAAGAGKNSNNPTDPGWDTAWNASLPKDAAALTTAVQCNGTTNNDQLPMNCIDWFEAEAFCIWDGGRLPTEAEWNYAAAGGDEQRSYPWGSTEPVGTDFAIYNCNFPPVEGSLCSSAPVGTAPKGNSRWGQADLAGNLWEWVQDWSAAPYALPCNNCANVAATSDRVLRGGCFGCAKATLQSSYRNNIIPVHRGNDVGARCARNP